MIRGPREERGLRAEPSGLRAGVLGRVVQWEGVEAGELEGEDSQPVSGWGEE